MFVAVGTLLILLKKKKRSAHGGPVDGPGHGAHQGPLAGVPRCGPGSHPSWLRVASRAAGGAAHRLVCLIAVALWQNRRCGPAALIACRRSAQRGLRHHASRRHRDRLSRALAEAGMVTNERLTNSGVWHPPIPWRHSATSLRRRLGCPSANVISIGDASRLIGSRARCTRVCDSGLKSLDCGDNGYGPKVFEPVLVGVEERSTARSSDASPARELPLGRSVTAERPTPIP